jgi:hypothetical protein
VTIVWIDSVRSTPYQVANTTARITANNGVVSVSEKPGDRSGCR